MPVFDNMPSWYLLVIIFAFCGIAALFVLLAYLAIRKRPFVVLSGWSRYGGFSLEARRDSDKPKARR